MFGNGTVFGGGAINLDAASYEAAPPGLPAAGASPDGLAGDGMGNVAAPGPGFQGRAAMPPAPPGALVIPTGRVPVASQAAAGMPGMEGYTWEQMEPQDVSPAGALRSAGVTALLIAAAVGTGVAVGGPWGAAAGLMVAGALANGYRAQKWWDSASPSEKHEAVVSGIFAAGTFGMGVYAAYKAYQAKGDKEEEE